jgi:hypothetical protein
MTGVLILVFMSGFAAALGVRYGVDWVKKTIETNRKMYSAISTSISGRLTEVEAVLDVVRKTMDHLRTDYHMVNQRLNIVFDRINEIKQEEK